MTLPAASPLLPVTQPQPTFTALIDTPLLLDWALHRYASLSDAASPLCAEMEANWFHDLCLARLFERNDAETLITLLRTLPAARFSEFVPLLTRQWPRWPDKLAGAAMPVLAAHAPAELCGLLEKYLAQTPVEQLSPDRFVYLHLLAADESLTRMANGHPQTMEHPSDACSTQNERWRGLAENLAQRVRSLSSGNIALFFFHMILLDNARALKVDTLDAMVSRALREETRAHAKKRLLGYLLHGLFGNADFLDFVKLRHQQQAPQKLTAIAALFVDQAPLEALDQFLRTPPSLPEALQALTLAASFSGDCLTLERLLGNPDIASQVDGLLAVQTALAGCLLGYAKQSPDAAERTLAGIINLLAADIDGDRWLAGLVEQLSGYPRGEVASQLLASLHDTVETYGGVRLVKAMGLLAWPEFVAVLIDALAEDKGDFICEAAASALKRIGAAGRDGVIARWDELDDSQRIYGLSVIRDVGGLAAADFAAARFEELMSESVDSACWLVLAAPDARLIELLHRHLKRKQSSIDRAYATLAKLVGQEDEDSAQAYARTLVEEDRRRSIQHRMERTDFSREYLSLDLLCPACGKTNTYDVARVILPGDKDNSLPYLVEGEICCASCDREVDFEFTPHALMSLTAETLLMQVANRVHQERTPLIGLLNCRIDGREMPIAAGLKQLRERLDRNPADSLSWYQQANLLAALKRPKAALSSLETAAKGAPDNLDISLARARLLETLGRSTEALQMLCQVRERLPHWQSWGSLQVAGQQFVEIYNGLRNAQRRLDLPAMHPASTKVLQQTRAGRNDPCPCGSGKKYKKCCG